MKNNKTFTISGFLDKFEKQSKNSEPSSELTNSPKSPKSPEANKDLTPATSPMELNKDDDADLFDDPFSAPKKDVVEAVEPSSSPFSSEQKEDEKARANKKTIKFTPRKLINFFDKNTANNEDSDSDSDLEVELSPEVMKARALDKLDKIKPSDNSSHYKYQRMFKQKLNQPKSLMAVVEAKHREQVMRDREEKMAAIKAKGGTVMTEEEKNKENDIIESLLEREQRKAEELRKQEQDDAEEEEDEDYNPEDGEGNHEDNALDILDEEELEDFDETEHVDQEASEEKAKEEDIEVMDEEGALNCDGDDEDQPPNLQRRKAKILVDSDDEEIDAVPAESKPTEVDSTQFSTDSMSQLFEQTQVPSGQSVLSPKSKMDALREKDEPISFTDQGSTGEEESGDHEPANTQQEIEALKLKYLREQEEAAAPEPTQFSQISAPSSSDVENDQETQVDSQQVVELEKKKKPTSYDRSKSAARAIVDEEAMESDDEWAGLGGQSDDDDDGNEEFLKELVDDNSKEASNEAAVRKLFAENERVADNKLVNQLMEDVTYGGWRKRKGNNGDSLGLSDDEFDEAYYREERRRREERKRQKLMEDESVSSLANNPKAQAFLNSIADHTVSIGKSIVGEEEGEEKDQEENSQQPSKKKWSIATIREQLSFLDEDEDGDEAMSQNIRKLPSKFTIEDEDEESEKEQEDEGSDTDDEIQAIQIRRRSEHNTVDRMSEKQSFIKSKNSQTDADDEEQPIQISSIKRVANVKTDKIIKDVEVLRSLSMPSRKNPRPAPSHKLPNHLQATKAKTTSLKKKKLVKTGISAKMFVKGEWES